MTPAAEYLANARAIANTIEGQLPQIHQAAEWFSQTILAGRMVHVFGSGHSRILVEEMWPRYGSFPGFNPMVELSLTFHNLVVGANGQRQAMFLENVSGLAEQILRNFDLSPADSALVISSSGCNRVPIEMAEGFRARGFVRESRRAGREAAGLRRPGARHRGSGGRCDGPDRGAAHARRSRVDAGRMPAGQQHQGGGGAPAHRRGAAAEGPHRRGPRR